MTTPLTHHLETVVITGAVRGIGRALAERFARAGYRTVMSDRHGSQLEASRADLAQYSVESVVADVTSAADMQCLAEAAGAVSIWINNAGLARHRAIVDYTEAEIDTMLAVNLKGTILGSQAALRSMAVRKRGLIVNVISTAGAPGHPQRNRLQRS